MAKMIQVPYNNDIVIPVETAQSVQKNRENPISLQALGLLTNLLSYPSTWDLNKTELYQRFGKDGEKSVRSAWTDLVDTNFIIEFKYRVGKKYEYVYYFRKVPFTKEEKAQILAQAEKEFGEIWGLRFGDSILDSPNGRGNQNPKYNKNPKYKEIPKSLKNEKTNQTLNTDDDKERENQSPQINARSISDEEELLITVLHEEMASELTDRSFNAVVRKVVDKHKQGKVKSFRDYLVTSLISKMAELELRRMKDEANAQLIKERTEAKRNQLNNADTELWGANKDLPFYNWLEQ